MNKPDPWGDIDFEEIMDATCLEMDDIKVLFGCFLLFDTKKQDYLLADEIDEVMRAMGFRPTAEELADLIEEIDEDGSGAIEFAEFAQLCAKSLVEDPDPETMRAELKQAFRLFDKECTGFITMDVLSKELQLIRVLCSFFKFFIISFLLYYIYYL